jgi:hypothetical protein
VAINTGYEGTGEGPIHHASKMVEEAKAFKSSLSDSAARFQETLDLRGRVQRNPIGMVIAAAGIGYVLGGGLFSPLTGRLVKIGVRLALIPLVKSQLGAVASEVMGQAGGRSSGSSAV